jgi:hypothetical protein
MVENSRSTEVLAMSLPTTPAFSSGKLSIRKRIKQICRHQVALKTAKGKGKLGEREGEKALCQSTKID